MSRLLSLILLALWLTVEGLALHEVEVVALAQDAVLEAPAEALQVAVVDVEEVALHDSVCRARVVRCLRKASQRE